MKREAIERLEAAFHEAAHAVASIRRKRAFECVLLAGSDGRLVLPSGEYRADSRGTVVGLWNDYWMYSPDAVEDAMLFMLAGIAATKFLKPHKSYFKIIKWGGASGDYSDALNVADLYLQSIGSDADRARFVESRFKTAGKFVKAEQLAIWAVALELNVGKVLPYRQCVRLVTDADMVTAGKQVRELAA